MTRDRDAEQLETRIVTATDRQITATVEDGQKRINGYALLFDQVDDLGEWSEALSPTAVSRTLSLNNDVRLSLNLDPNGLLGRTYSGTARIGADQTGLWYQVDLPDTAAGGEAWTHAQRGDLYGTACTFSVTKHGQQWSTDDGRTLRRITELRLIGLGPVTTAESLDVTVAALHHESHMTRRVDDQAEPDPAAMSIVRRRLRTVH